MKNIFSIFALLCSLNLFAIEPYDSVADLPFDEHGWFGHHEAFTDIFAINQPKVAIEVGSWLGLSTRFIANLLPEDGKVYAVDTWVGSPTEDVHMRDPRRFHLYQLFLSNVKHAGLQHKIVPIRMASIEAANGINVMADFIYIDASHEYIEVYRDVHHWYKHLNPNGVMCGDDWLWPGVREAVIRAARELNREIYAKDNFWMFL